MKRVFLSIALIFLAILLSSETYVKGSVHGKWIDDNSPYIIQSDITIDKGNSLSIQENVKVVVAGNHQITVEGSLIAIGSKNNNIIIKPGKSIKTWKGIVFKGNNESVLKYAKILNAFNGLDLNNLPVNLDNISLEIEDGSNMSAVHISNNSKASIKNCFIQGYKNGFTIKNYSAYECLPTINNTNVCPYKYYKGSTTGLRLDGYVNAQINNCFFGNFRTGIDIINKTPNTATPYLQNVLIEAYTTNVNNLQGIRIEGNIIANLESCIIIDYNEGINLITSKSKSITTLSNKFSSDNSSNYKSNGIIRNKVKNGKITFNNISSSKYHKVVVVVDDMDILSMLSMNNLIIQNKHDIIVGYNK